MLRVYCRKNKIVFVDFYSEMKMDDGGINPKYSDDGVHPNLAGYKKMEDIFAKIF